MYTMDVFIGSVASVEFCDMEYNMKTNRYLKRTDLLIEVRDCIQNNPQRFNYGRWFKNPTDPYKLYDVEGKYMQCDDNWCGTLACVAGHAIALSCPPGVTIRRFMIMITDGLYQPPEDRVANTILEVYEEHTQTIKYFLYLPWYFGDKNGKIVTERLDDHPELALKEAINRINWILDDKPLEDYEIQFPELIQG